MKYSYERNSSKEPNPIAKLGQNEDWTQGLNFPDLGSHFDSSDPGKWLGMDLLRKAFAGGPPVTKASWEGNLIVPLTQLLGAMETALGLRIVSRAGSTERGCVLFMGANNETMVSLDLYERGRRGSASIVTTDETILRKTQMLFDRVFRPDDPAKGLVFVLAAQMGGYAIRRLGVAGSPMIRENYTPEVIHDYDHVVQDFNTSSPCGRLVIMAGEPGTGKTFLVRSLLKDVPRAAFILVPPHLIEELAAPSMLPALTEAKGQIDGPIILIIEDADRCLVPREKGDINAISSLLNLGDGILGSVLDLRVVATTNAKRIQIDPATQRPGRLCRYMEVGSLSEDLANKALKRLVPGLDFAFEKNTTIAEVYRKARELGWVPPKDESTVNPEVALRKDIL